MSDAYSLERDGLGSWLDGVSELRDRHRRTVQAFLPALRTARMRKRIPYRSFAQELGVSPSALNAWECGHHIPPADLFSRWRNLLGV
jgi:ribosome-binding protein aMBF1 (putative translation factor)